MRASNSEIFSALNVKPSVNRTSLRQITNILNTGSTSPKAKFTLGGRGRSGEESLLLHSYPAHGSRYSLGKTD